MSNKTLTEYFIQKISAKRNNLDHCDVFILGYYTGKYGVLQFETVKINNIRFMIYLIPSAL